MSIAWRRHFYEFCLIGVGASAALAFEQIQQGGVGSVQPADLGMFVAWAACATWSDPRRRKDQETR